MQANCPTCQNKIVIDDAKVPDRAFSVKCPKCQNVVRFPGKGGAAAGTAPAAPPPSAEPAAAPAPDSEVMRAQMREELRREREAAGKPQPKALVSLGDRTLSGSITVPLTRQGYTVETNDNPEEGGRLLEQGAYDLVATTRSAGAGGKESLYQRLNRLSPESRRRIFLILVGDEFKSGDGTQAWVTMSDLVLHTQNAGNCDAVLLSTLSERHRLFQVYLDARRRFEETAG